MSHFILIVIILIYLGVVGFFGFKGYTGTRNQADYLLAGRNVHPFVMAMSYGATFISTSAIVGFGGVASVYGLSMYWMVFVNIFVGIFLAFVLFGKRTRSMGLKLDAHTFPELLARRVDSRFIQIFAGLIIFAFMPVYTAAVLIGAARIIEGLLHIPYSYSVIIFTVLVGAYVIMGGLKGVMYTDALQGSLMFIGLAALTIMTLLKTGGPASALEALSQMSDRIPEPFLAGGITSWTRSPAAGSPNWWVLYSSLVLGVGIGVLAQPQLVVRFMTVRSSKELNRAVLIGSVFILVTVGAGYIVGPLSNVYFMEHFGKTAFEMAGKNLDIVIPVFIEKLMPSWFVYLFMLVILSAAMSTLSSQFHAIGTSVGRDVYEYGIGRGRRDRRTEAAGTLITRIGIILALIMTAWFAFNMEAGVIARATAIFFGIMASCFLAPYMGVLFWKRLTRKGMIAGILAGFLTVVFCFLFLHGKEAAVFGICRLLTGRDTLLGGVWPFVDPLVFALPVSALFTLLVSLLTKVENEETVLKCFE